jgi:hypothetical protein
MPWQRLEQTNGQTLRGEPGREREFAGANFLLDGLQVFDKIMKIPSRRFGSAQADAMPRWKWRRKLLERLISAMEVARS